MGLDAGKISLIIGGAVVGVLWSLLSFHWLKGQAAKINPNTAEKGDGLSAMIISRILRWLITAALLYVAIRLDVFAAFAFVFGMTVARLYNVIRYNRSLNQNGIGD